MDTRPETRGERSYGGLDRAQRDAQRRRRLLDAGLETFGVAGYSGAAVEGICTAAGVSTRNFYDHFENREALLIAVYDEIVAEALGRVGSALARLDASASLETWARSGLEAFTAFMLGDPRRARVNFLEVVGASQSVEAHRRGVLMQFAALVTHAASTLEGPGRLGEWSAAQLRVAVSVLIGGVQETLTAWLAEPETTRTPLSDVVDSLVTIVVLVAGPSA